MAPVIFVEVLDQRGAVRARTRLDAFPATVGRGYDCDVIVDDPHVCARHLRLAEDTEGRLVAEDAGSVNGTRAVRGAARVDRLVVASGSELRIGHTTLRFRTADHPVPATVPDGAPGFLRRFERTEACLAASAGAYILFALLAWLQSYGESDAAETLGSVLAIGFGVALWSGVWALANRAAAHTFAFVRHFTVASMAALAATLLVELSAWVEFALPDHDVVSVASGLLALALCLATLAAHLSVVSAAVRAVRWRWAFGITGALALLTVVAALGEDDFSASLDEPGAVRPLPVTWLRTTPVERLTDELPLLQATVDSLARER